MSRFTGSSWKVSRRLNYSISETGKELIKRKYAPGQHGAKRTKLKEYGIQLQEKQRVRFTYGVSEKQFYKTFVEASKMAGKNGVNFLKLLEWRPRSPASSNPNPRRCLPNGSIALRSDEPLHPQHSQENLPDLSATDPARQSQNRHRWCA